MASDQALVVHLTEKQSIAAHHIAMGVPADVACAIAGYADPPSAAYALRNNPQVQVAVAQNVRKFLYFEAAPAAIRLQYDFMMDPANDKKLRLSCSKTIADRAGYVPPKAKDHNALDGKNVTEMTADEMKDMALRIQKELADRATPVIDNAPQLDDTKQQAFDMLD